jgi:3-phenylpropionate/trans-cinnamate dioxygenase ferredoxin subunit
VADYVVIAKTVDVQPGQMKSFAVDGKLVLIANWEGMFFATQDLCTHDNGTLADGELAEGQIECPRHGARFDLKTGRGTMPAVFPIKTFPVKVVGDNILAALD